MAYQIEDQNGNQPRDAKLWEAAINAFEQDKTWFEFDGQDVLLVKSRKIDTDVTITIHMDEEL